MHGLIINHQSIHYNDYSVKWDKSRIEYNFFRTPVLFDCEEMLNDWCIANKFELKKVRILTSLIYLNIAVLHEYPYSILLYALGKKLLYSELNK